MSIRGYIKMKKSVIIILALLTLNVFIISLASAESIPGVPSGLDKLVGGVDSAANKIDEIKSGDYSIKQPIIEKAEATGIKGVILAVADFFSIFDPFFKIVLGVEYSFTLAFILAIILWFTLFFLISPILSVIFAKKIYGYIGGFCIASLIGLSGVVRKTVDTISLAIKTPKLAVICFIIALIIVLLSAFFKELFKKSKEEEKKEQEKRDREILHAGAEAVKKQLSQKD